MERLDVKYFHVWAEPASGMRWIGDFDDYCKLYKASAEGVSRFNEEYRQGVRIGGPKCNARWGCNKSFKTDSMTRQFWWQDFVDFCVNESIALDYITYNHYPQISIFGKWSENIKSFDDKTSKMRDYLESKGFKDTKVFITEWNPGVREGS
jgi:hypothetical protein